MNNASIDPSASITAVPAAKSVRPGKGLAVALLLLFAVEFALHQDAVLYRLRSVFAAGRALDKVLYVETHRPDIVIFGNSRADNGFDPKTVVQAMNASKQPKAFNLGLPGADARVLAGVAMRLDQSGAFGANGVKYVVLSMDEALLQEVDTLGQEVFFANRNVLLEQGEYLDWFRSSLRLYGYSDNFRQLSEPGTLSRFIHALRQSTEPVGGAAREHAGYRAGMGMLQGKAAAMKQEAGSRQPPSKRNLGYLWRLIDQLTLRGVKVAVVFPPLLNRNVLYLSRSDPMASPYINVVRELERRNIPLIVLDQSYPRNPSEFINAGHLNDRGAQRYSKILGQALARAWPGLVELQE